MTRADRIAELRSKLAREHTAALTAPDLESREPLNVIANETARELVLLLAQASRN